MISSSVQSCGKYPEDHSGLYTLILNNNNNNDNSNAIEPSDFIAENYHVQSDPSSKDIVCWTLNESNSENKQTNVYFIVPPENVHFAQQDKSISFVDFGNISYPQNHILQFKNCIQNNSDGNVENNQAPVNSKLFDCKLLSSSVISEENANLNDEIYKKCESDNSDIASFDERLSKRDSLLPQRYCEKKKRIKSNKYKFQENSISALSCRDILKHSNHKTTSQLKEKANCKKAIRSKYKHRGAVELHHCPYCHYSSSEFLLVKYHIRRTHNKKNKFICKLCKKIFFRVHDLKMHLNVHLKLKCYICHACGRQFSHSSNLARHLRVHTKVRPYSCPVCDRRFSQLPSLLNHQISHTSGGKCPDCNTLFRSISGLRKHINSIHKRKLCSNEIKRIFYKTSDDTLVKPRFFNCRICSERFQYKKGLKLHEEQFHSNSSIPCKSCFKIYLRNEDFMAHACYRVSKKHQSKNNSTFKCSTCFQICKTFKDAECHICDPFISKSLSKFGITVIPEDNSNPNDVVVLYFNNTEDNCISELSSRDSVSESSIYLEGNEIGSLNNQTIRTNSLNKIVNTISPKITNSVGNELSQNNMERNTSDDSEMYVMASRDLTDLGKSKIINISDNKTGKKISVRDNTIQTNLEDQIDMAHSADDEIETTQLGNNTVGIAKLLDNDMAKTESVDSKGKKSKTKNDNKVSKNKNLPMNVEDLVERPIDSKDLTMEESSDSPIESKDFTMSFKCKYCGKEFSKMWNWSQHMGTHDVSMRNYTCDICSKSFSYRSTFTNHMKIHSSSVDIKKFSCTQCVKTYNSKGSLSHHIKRVHEQKQNYFCSECSKGFYVKSTYMYHLRLHKKELIYICCFCARKFSHLSHLRRHERMHTGEKPHKCPHCPKSFIQPVTLRAHIRKHHFGSHPNTNELAGSASFKEVVVQEADGGTEKEFAVITMEEISDLSQFANGEPDGFGSYVGIDSSI